MPLTYFEERGHSTESMRDKFEKLQSKAELSLADFFSECVKIITE